MTAATGFFSAGILTFQWFSKLPAPMWLMVGALLVCVCAMFRRWRLMLYVIGLIWAAAAAIDRCDKVLPRKLEGKDIVVTGTIIGLPQPRDIGVRFDLLTDRGQTAHGIPDKLRITWYAPQVKLSAGQRWRLTVRLKQPHGTMNPGTFDYEQWLFVNGIGATGYVRKEPAPVLLDNGGGGLSTWRQHLADKLQAMLNGGDYPGIIQALVIGERHAITPEQWQLLRNTGTVHLMAISGLHIGLVAGLVYFVVAKLAASGGAMRIAPQNMAAFAALSVAVLYAGLAGFSIPTVRALIMLAIVMTAIFLQRNTEPWAILVLALGIILLIDPFAGLSSGFWLSFGSVALIIFSLAARRRQRSYWFAMLKINGAVSLGLAPLTLFFFQQVSLIAPLANLIAVPLTSFVIVPLALLATVALEFIPVIAEQLFRVVDMALHLLFEVLAYLSALPYASVKGVQPDTAAMLMAVAGSLLLLSPAGLPGRWLGFVLSVPLVVLQPEKMAPGSMRFTLLDVGQGLAAVVQTENHLLVYDAGARLSSTYDMGNRVVLPYLHTLGRDKVDMLMISHSDNDHSGGAFSIMRQVDVGQVVTSAPELFDDGRAIRCLAGQRWIWDSVEFHVLAPPEAGFAADNDNSCVLKITGRLGSVLLTGDIEASAETWLIDHYADYLQADILIAPHHGSKSSSSRGFLEQVAPQAILISAGYRNKYRHPNRDVLAAYKKLHVQYLNTANEGALELLFQENEAEIISYRQQQSRYWNWPFAE